MKEINNSSWVSPGPDLAVLLLLIFLTVVAEGGLVYLYMKQRKLEGKTEFIAVIVLINFVSGLLGFIIGMLGGI